MPSKKIVAVFTVQIYVQNLHRKSAVLRYKKERKNEKEKRSRTIKSGLSQDVRPVEVCLRCYTDASFTDILLYCFSCLQ